MKKTNTQGMTLGAVGSSTNPAEVSASVSGLILAFSSVIILIAGSMGLNVAQTEIAEFSAQVGTAIGAVWFIFGVVRKVVVALSVKYTT